MGTRDNIDGCSVAFPALEVPMSAGHALLVSIVLLVTLWLYAMQAPVAVAMPAMVK